MEPRLLTVIQERPRESCTPYAGRICVALRRAPLSRPASGAPHRSGSTPRTDLVGRIGLPKFGATTQECLERGGVARCILHHLTNREAMISFNSDLEMAWSYFLSISALRQPRSSTSASRARSSSGRAAEQLTHFLHAEGGVQVADRMRRETW